MDNILDGLNPQQKEAVLQTEGPVLILAGAGSGKTKALTHRIAYLIQEKKVSPYNILAVTFTNKAAQAMAERVAVLLKPLSACSQKPEASSRRISSVGSQESVVSSSDALQTTDHQPPAKLPWMGTFHSVCVKILRREIKAIGYSQNFTIYDEQDSLNAVKRAMLELKIDTKNYNPRAIRSIISSAKCEMMSPQEYEKYAQGHFQEIASKVFYKYEKFLKSSEALDFDDLLNKTVQLFLDQPAILEKYQNLFKYILVDEYQDTNHTQYLLCKLLAQKHKNIFVIGDDWQCLVPGSLVETKKGIKKIEIIRTGEMVRAAAGYGKTDYFKVSSKKKFTVNGEIIQIRTASGKEINCTPNHILFTRWVKTDSYFVYLMYSHLKGYRIGIVKGTRFDGKKDDIGLRVRANQERADRMWVIKVCPNREEAVYTESLFAYEYGIPMLVFHAFKNRSMKFSQKHIDALYSKINTVQRAEKLMADLGLVFEYPHFLPQATVRNGIKRVNVNMVLFGDKRTTNASSWSASRLSINTTNRRDMQVFKKLGYAVRTGRAETFRSEIQNMDYGKIEKILEQIQKEDNGLQVNKYGFLTGEKYQFMPAGQVHIDMVLPVIKDNQLMDDRVASVTRKKYSGPVYDLNIEKVHNYIASGVAVHNSIYSWRGARYRNILDFEKDYPSAKIIKLEENYRSTQNILDAAQNIISRNIERSDKKIWTKRGGGDLVTVYESPDGQAEVDFLIQEAAGLSKRTNVKLKDIVVLYRTNAQSRAIEERLIEYNIPYRIIGGVRFYERKEIKDMLAYLNFIQNPKDMVSLERIINFPPRKIGKKAWSDVVSNGLTETAQTNANIQSFIDTIKKLRESVDEITVSELIERTLHSTGIYKFYNDGNIENESRLENIQELRTVAEKHEKLSEFLEEVKLISDVDNYDEQADALTLMTLHSAKGLEFPVVFLVGMEEGLFPHSRALMDNGELEEERRLCYVGMTRAKDKLYLTCASSRMMYGAMQHNQRSRFLDEIPEELLDEIE